MHSNHELEKSVWTHEDFEVMGWHDSFLYGFMVDPETFELIFDIDYIAKWVKPVDPEIYFKFWVTPVTLAFQHVSNINISIKMDVMSDIEFSDIKRTPIDGNLEYWHWVIQLADGEISFDSKGYTQFFRSEPVLTGAQSLGIVARGGISYSRVAFHA